MRSYYSTRTFIQNYRVFWKIRTLNKPLLIGYINKFVIANVKLINLWRGYLKCLLIMKISYLESKFQALLGMHLYFILTYFSIWLLHWDLFMFDLTEKPQVEVSDWPQISFVWLKTIQSCFLPKKLVKLTKI